MSTNIATSNKLLNSDDLKTSNARPLTLKLADRICSQPSEIVSFINDTFRHRLNVFIIARYLNVVFDDNVINENPAAAFTANDLQLLNRMLDAAIFTRHTLHNKLCSIVNVVEDISSQIVYSQLRGPFKTSVAKRLLERSKTINPEDARTASHVGKTVDFSLFMDADARRSSDKTDQIKSAIETKILRWLGEINFDVNLLEDDDSLEIKSYITSNKSMIDLALHTRKLINLEKQKLASHDMSSLSLFHEEIVRLSLDSSGQRCTFSLQPNKFLVKDCSLTIYFPETASYVLGGGPNPSTDKVVIGPLKYDANDNVDFTLTHQIVHTNQQLPFPLRTLPNLLHVATDLVTSKCHDSWLQRSNYSDRHIIYSYLMEESVLTNRSIADTNCNSDFYRLRYSSRLLELMSFSILDSNFRKCRFPLRTYCRLCLQIRPCPL